jgi:hypothetical protein
MRVTIHQKIRLRSLMLQYGININGYLKWVNTNDVLTRRASRRCIAFFIYSYTGQSVMFVLNSPYTQYYKPHRSILRDGEPRQPSNTNRVGNFTHQKLIKLKLGLTI